MGKKSKIKYRTPSAGLTAMAAPTQISGIRSSIGLDTAASDLYQIRVEFLIPYRSQARKHFDEEEISALAATIQEFGIRNPLTVIKHSDDDSKYEVVSGERRLRAAIQIGLSKVPCIILSDRSKANEVALIENVQRTDLHPIEAAQAYQALLDSNTYTTQQEIAEKISVKKSQVSESLKLNTLPEEIKQYLITHNIKSRELFRKLLSFETQSEMESLLKINNHAPSNKTMKSASILRITLSEGEYKIQKKAMSVLNIDQKRLLKEKLLEIISLL
jgi:ParB family transcriptional regulator, chromosome partitioning protein